MKFGPDHGFDLAYCTNIHPGEQWSDVAAALEHHVLALKERLAPDRPFGVGLRLGAAAAADIDRAGRAAEIGRWLNEHGLYVFTINGFPHGSFHRQRVKEAVFSPAWSDAARLDYTLRLARLAATWARPGAEIGISTVPLGYRPALDADPEARRAALSASAEHLATAAADLDELRRARDVLVHIDLEPEPDGLLECAIDVVAFFERWLLPAGSQLLVERGWRRAQAVQLLRRHIRVCLDVCHSSVVHHDPVGAMRLLGLAGIQIGKLQLSAALEFSLADDRGQRQAIHAALEAFAEPTYLHQGSGRGDDGKLHRFADLGPALDRFADLPCGCWRVHYHVPLFSEGVQPLRSTRAHTRAALEHALRSGTTRHLEIETYTWELLPAPLRLGLTDSLEREYRWVLEAAGAEVLS